MAVVSGELINHHFYRQLVLLLVFLTGVLQKKMVNLKTIFHVLNTKNLVCSSCTTDYISAVVLRPSIKMLPKKPLVVTDNLAAFDSGKDFAFLFVKGE